MEVFTHLLKEGPWFALAITIIFLIVKAIKYLGLRFFDDDVGFVPRLVKRHEEFLETTGRSTERMTVAMMGCTDQIRALERRLEGAWTARHSDPEIWELLFVNNPVPMAMISREGFFLQVNQALCGLLGYTSVELKSMNWQQVTPADTVANEMAMREDLIMGGESIRYSKALIRKDGVPQNVTLHGFRYPRMGVFRHFFAFYLPE